MIDESAGRDAIVTVARSIFDRSLTHGATGNISLRVADGILVTPSGSSLGTVRPEDLSMIELDGSLRAGRPPSKEAFLHAAMLRARPQDAAVIHTHSSNAAAVSCLDGLDPDEAIPPLTAYFAMRVGRLPLLPYHAPGDPALGPLAEKAAADHTALLLSNHGPIVAGRTLDSALDAIEELEETARIFLLLYGRRVRMLSDAQVAALRPRPEPGAPSPERTTAQPIKEQ